METFIFLGALVVYLLLAMVILNDSAKNDLNGFGFAATGLILTMATAVAAFTTGSVVYTCGAAVLPLIPILAYFGMRGSLERAAAERRAGDRAELQQTLPTLPGDFNAVPVHVPHAFSSMPPQLESYFQPYEDRLRTLQRSGSTLAITIGAIVLVVTLGICFAIPHKDDVPAAQPAPAAQN